MLPLLCETLPVPLLSASSGSALSLSLLTTLPELTRHLPLVLFPTLSLPTGPRRSSTVPSDVPLSPRAQSAAALELLSDPSSPDRASSSTALTSPSVSTVCLTPRPRLRQSRLAVPAYTPRFAIQTFCKNPFSKR